MKKILLFMAALCLSSLSFAQVLVATLQHGDSIRVFYHANAFVDAYNAATTGDVISLSAGSFSTPTSINKDSLTIRGVGSNGSHPTVFASSFNLGNNPNNCHHITMEGIYCGGTVVSFYGSRTAYFQDVYFGRLSYNTYNAFTGQLVNCRIGTYCPYSSWTPTLINCLIGDVSSYSQSTFVNCVVLDNQFNSYYDNVSLISSIIVYTGSQNLTSSSYQLPATTYAENCICVNTNSSVTGNLFARCVNNNSTMATPAVFSNFNLDAMNPERYVLTDSAQTAYPSSDSTQIGLYGGYMPYTTSSTYPVISRLNVAHQTTADGQLSVDIQVGYRQESEDNE